MLIYKDIVIAILNRQNVNNNVDKNQDINLKNPNKGSWKIPTDEIQIDQQC